MSTENDSRRGAGLADTQAGDGDPGARPGREGTFDDGEGPPTNPTLDSRSGSRWAKRKSDEPLPRILEGRWRLEREIGAGGMGRVFEARHVTLGNRVAVKLLHAQRLGAPEAVHRFLREARLAGVASHPGIARVFDFDLTGDGTPYMVMEFLSGATLEDRLLGPTRISLSEGIDVLIDVLDTLAAIHAAGVVHRDIKPGNIFVQSNPNPVRTKLLDFGLARGIDTLWSDPTLTRTGQVIGTPLYMSPEQARGQTQVGPDADLWAIGVMLYELATGRRPFPGENYNETLANILTRDPPPLRQVAPELPPALESVLRRCFARDPARRYRSAADLSAALAALRPQLIRPRAAGGDGRGRRRLFIAAMIAAGVAAAGISGGLSLIGGAGPEPPAPPLQITWSPYRDAAFLGVNTRWLLDELGHRVGQPIAFVAASSYDDAAARLLSGQVDVAGLSAASYVRAVAREPALVLLARVASNGADTYQSILFTRATAPLRDVTDVRGRSICLVDPSSTSGYVYPRAMLRRAGLDPDRDLGPVVFGGNHQRVAELLAQSQCEVAGSSTSALTQWAEDAGIAPATFRILVASEPIPGDALVARAGLSPALLARLRAAVDTLITDTESNRFPRDREISGLLRGQDRDYDPVRSLIAAPR